MFTISVENFLDKGEENLWHRLVFCVDTLFFLRFTPFLHHTILALSHVLRCHTLEL